MSQAVLILQGFLIIASKINTDCIIRTWFLNTEDLIEEACRRVSRKLTEEEWKEYLPDEPYNTPA